MLFSKAYVTVGIGDLKGVETINPIKIGQTEYTLNGTSDEDVYVNVTFNNNTDYTKFSQTEYEVEVVDIDDYTSSTSGCMQASISIDSTASAAIPYSITMLIRGSQSLGVTPIGAESKISMAGICKSPSFAGMVIPTERSIEADSFSAKWIVNSINRDYPQSFIGDKPYKISRSAVVTNMLVPVDRYQKTSRAMKYAIIVVLLTFISVLLQK